MSKVPKLSSTDGTVESRTDGTVGSRTAHRAVSIECAADRPLRCYRCSAKIQLSSGLPVSQLPRSGLPTSTQSRQRVAGFTGSGAGSDPVRRPACRPVAPAVDGIGATEKVQKSVLCDTQRELNHGSHRQRQARSQSATALPSK